MSSTNTSKVVSFAKAAVILLPIIAAVTGGYYALKSDVRDLNTRQEQQGERLKAVEARSDRIEAKLSAIGEDVAWIRHSVETRAR